MLACGTFAGDASPAARRPPAQHVCTVFPHDNPWNQRVDALPVAASSSTIIASIGASTGLHADFGSGPRDGSPIGIPVTTVSSSTPLSTASFDYASESDPGPYPIPTLGRVPGSASEVVDTSPLQTPSNSAASRRARSVR